MNNSTTLLIVLTLLTIAPALGQEGCQLSAGGLRCTLLSSHDFTPFLPHAGLDTVRWMTLYVGISSDKHSDNSQPITYPDWTQFSRLSFLIINIFSTTPSPNYAPEDMFLTLDGGLSVLRLLSYAPVPFDVRALERGTGFGRLKSLRVTKFNISGVSELELETLSNLDVLELINTGEEGDKETVPFDSVFRISNALPKLAELSMENFEFLPLTSSRDLISPLPGLESLSLTAADENSATDVSVFFDNRIFPALESLELDGFRFSQISDSTPPLTKLRLKSGNKRPFALSGLSLSLRFLELSDFNLGNLTTDSFRGLSSLELLYLSGSEDTIEVSGDTFLNNAHLTRLRISRMPNLIRFSDRALVGLTSLTYLHLGTLNSLRTLDADTTDLRLLSSLYITSNRELTLIPVEFFRPLASLEMLNVQSNRFDDDCGCEHSYLSSFLTYSRADPKLTLRSSCHDFRRFDRCQKNHFDTLCWDFEGRCEYDCVPTGNLSYSCVCGEDMGQLGQGGECVDLSRCIPTSNGVTSHNCFRSGFTCARHRNHSISCSCNPQHAIRPDGLACSDLAPCVRSGDSYSCDNGAMACTETKCRCVGGAEWDDFSKTCVPPATTPITTTTPTTVIITTTAEPSTTTTTPVVITEPATTTETTKQTTTTTKVPTTTQEPTTTTPTVAPTTTTATIPTTTTEEPVIITDPTTTTTTTPTAPTTTTTTTTTPTVPTTTTTTHTTGDPISGVDTTTPVSTTYPIDTLPTTTPINTQPDTTTTTTTTTTEPIEPSTPPEPIGPGILNTDLDPTSTPVLILPTLSLSDLGPNISYIVGFTVGGICVGGLIILLATLLVVLLVKICLYSGSTYKIVGNKSKHESLRSFESSNSSSASSKYKDLSV